jgi:hypothetical protein
MARAITIDQEACLGLLSGAALGRVALSVHALPRIVPVRLAIHQGRITAYPRGTGEPEDTWAGVVALQADGHDDVAQQGWSVHIIGRVVARSESGFVIDPGVIEGAWQLS